jgi:Protein of unknown function (DUF3987)
LRDELVGLIATWEREGREGERAFFLEAWNGNQSFDTDRIGRGHISIPNLCASVFGGIQPDKLTVYLEQAAHALANDGMLHDTGQTMAFFNMQKGDVPLFKKLSDTYTTKDEFLLAAIAQNLRKLAKLVPTQLEAIRPIQSGARPISALRLPSPRSVEQP